MKRLTVVIGLGLLLASNVTQAQQVQELHYGNGIMLQSLCQAPDKPDSVEADQIRCIMLLDGLIGGITYRANKEGVCLFDVKDLPEMEKVRKQVVAWFLLNKVEDFMNRPEASIVEEVLMKLYPCK